MRKLKIYTLLLTAAILITTVTACTSQTTPKKRTNHIEKTTESGTYNATVVVRDNDTENRRLAFVNIADGARETYRSGVSLKGCMGKFQSNDFCNQ